MRRLALILATSALLLLGAAVTASAYPAPVPAYNNRVAPSLEDGQETLPVRAPSSQAPGKVTVSKRCSSARRGVKRAARKIRALKRKLKRTHRRARRRRLKRGLRKWRRAYKRARKRRKKYCPKAASAAVDYPATHRTPNVSCVASAPGGYVSLPANPTMRAQAGQVQYVAYTAALFRLSGGRWVYYDAAPDYYWTIASPYGDAGWVDSQNRAQNDGPIFLVPAGSYRVAVRYHWWANTNGARAGTAWHWAGTHRLPYPAKPAKYCSFSS